MSESDKASIEAFRRNVVEPSRSALVILDFWAEWCGPCKQLTPVLEKVAADYAAKGVKLVKINVEEERFIAAQFQVKSIPTVYAIFQGQPVADLTPARTETQLKAMLDKLLAQLPVESEAKDLEQEIAPLLAMASDVLQSGDSERALSIYEQIAEMVPEDPDVASGRALALLSLARRDEAEAVLDALPADAAKGHPGVDQARAALALARDATPVADLSALAAKVAANPDDMDAAFELAGGHMANGDRDAAADTLLAMIQRDRDWNEGAAKARLLTLFEALGLEDPWVSSQRRRLSAILFG